MEGKKYKDCGMGWHLLNVLENLKKENRLIAFNFQLKAKALKKVLIFYSLKANFCENQTQSLPFL